MLPKVPFTRNAPPRRRVRPRSAARKREAAMRRPRVRMVLSVGATATVVTVLVFWLGSTRAEGDDPVQPPARGGRTSLADDRPSHRPMGVPPPPPAAGPPPRRMVVPPPKPMSPEFDALLTRGVFGRPAPAERRKPKAEPA